MWRGGRDERPAHHRGASRQTAEVDTKCCPAGPRFVGDDRRRSSAARTTAPSANLTDARRALERRPAHALTLWPTSTRRCPTGCTLWRRSDRLVRPGQVQQLVAVGLPASARPKERRFVTGSASPEGVGALHQVEPIGRGPTLTTATGFERADAQSPVRRASAHTVTSNGANRGREGRRAHAQARASLRRRRREQPALRASEAPLRAHRRLLLPPFGIDLAAPRARAARGDRLPPPRPRSTPCRRGSPNCASTYTAPSTC